MVGFGHVQIVPVDVSHRRMPTNEELSAWMHAVATSGDRPAFAALFRHFAPRLHGFLLRSGADPGLADELVQEAMAALWRRAASYDPARAQVSTWIFTIARNLRIDHQRRSAGFHETDDDWDVEQYPCDAHLAPEDLLLAVQRERAVRQALAELPPEQARVIQLSFFDEQAHSRIAHDLGIPLGTVKSRIRLAMTQLRRLLDLHKS